MLLISFVFVPWIIQRIRIVFVVYVILKTSQTYVDQFMEILYSESGNSSKQLRNYYLVGKRKRSLVSWI